MSHSKIVLIFGNGIVVPEKIRKLSEKNNNCILIAPNESIKRVTLEYIKERLTKLELKKDTALRFYIEVHGDAYHAFMQKKHICDIDVDSKSHSFILTETLMNTLQQYSENPIVIDFFSCYAGLAKGSVSSLKENSIALFRSEEEKLTFPHLNNHTLFGSLQRALDTKLSFFQEFVVNYPLYFSDAFFTLNHIHFQALCLTSNHVMKKVIFLINNDVSEEILKNCIRNFFIERAKEFQNLFRNMFNESQLKEAIEILTQELDIARINYFLIGCMNQMTSECVEFIEKDSSPYSLFRLYENEYASLFNEVEYLMSVEDAHDKSLLQKILGKFQNVWLSIFTKAIAYLDYEIIEHMANNIDLTLLEKDMGEVDGGSLLHLAVSRDVLQKNPQKALQIAKLLINNETKRDAKFRGRTPLEWVKSYGNQEAENALQQLLETQVIPIDRRETRMKRSI